MDNEEFIEVSIADTTYMPAIIPKWTVLDNRAALEPSVKTRIGGSGRRISYSSHEAIRRALNEVFGPFGWQHVIVNRSADQRTVTGKERDEETGRLTGKTVQYEITEIILETELRVLVRESVWFTRSGIGYGTYRPNNPNDSKANAMKAAESDAIVRAAFSFGDRFGLWLWAREEVDSTDKPASPEMIANVRRSAEKLGIDAEADANTKYGVSLSGLTAEDAQEMLRSYNRRLQQRKQ